MGKQGLYKDELKKLLIIYSVSFVLASILVVFAFIQIYSSRIVRINNKEANEIASEAILNELDAYEVAINSIQENDLFREFVQTGKKEAEVYRIIYDFINNRQLKSIFYYVDTKGETIITNNYIESPYNSSDIFLSGLFKQLGQRPDEVIYLNNKIQIDLSKRTVYSIGKGVIVDGEVVGYLLFELLESDFNKIIYQANAQVLVLTDRYNNVITTTNSLILNEIGKFNLAKNNKDTLMFNDKEYYYYKSELNRGELSLYTLSTLEIFSELMARSLLFMVGIFILFTTIAVAVAGISAKDKTKSIENLIGSIEKVQKGDLEAYVQIGKTNEFKFIGEQFNKMLVDLNSLLDKNNELVDRNRMSEIKQLESQFNPHFIFNTLETLKYMVHIDKDKSSDIIVNFANILRYSIDYEQKNIELDSDIDYLNSYLLIQKYRYNKRLNYNFDIQKESKECIVPKLIMQPIIENCINHGYKKKESLHIDVLVRIHGDQLITIITDDGDGIKPIKLQELQTSLNDTAHNSGHIGLINVHRRIKLLYGDEYGIKIDSVSEEGTIVTINMPVVRW